MSLYNAKKVEAALRITKFDEDLEVESSYITTPDTCECPAGTRDTCRHRQMYHHLANRANTPWFFDFDDDRWYYYSPEAGLLLDREPQRRNPLRRL